MATNKDCIWVIALILGIHLLLRLFATGFYGLFGQSFSVALIISQLGLIAIWGSLSKLTFNIRIPLTVLALILCAFIPPIDSFVEQNPDTSDPELDSFFLEIFFWLYGGVFFSLTFIPMLALHASRLARNFYLRSKFGVTSEYAHNLQFGIRSLLITTTLFAMALGIGKLVFNHFEITFSLKEAELLAWGMLIGLLPAANSLILLALLMSSKHLLRKTIFAILAIESLGAFFAIYTANWSSMLLVNIQIVLYVATLLPLRRFGMLPTSL
jgi:hypothetical protein